MSRVHYTQAEFVTALKNIGIKRGDTLYSHSNIGFFGRPEGAKTVADAFEIILEAVLTVIGAEGTLVVPTFTYSFPKNQIFDYNETASTCGVFTEMLRQYPDVHRSLDPCISVAAIGAKAVELTTNMPVNAYGVDSFFDRFYAHNGIICNFNFDAGSTFIHYVERCLNVPYRFDKLFKGQIIYNDQIIDGESCLFVRYLADGTEAKFEPFDRLARLEGLYRTQRVGRGFVGAISAKQTFDLIKMTLPYRPWLLTAADEAMVKPDITQFVAN
ncbi:MAG TPA: AAC(3) family N-acetyltransferase [Anaerolineae bacterium]|nr:AAC(3) family N-acetyltransferase [Anaerolineae bacterium]